MAEAKNYTPREELANSFTHLVGFVFALASTTTLLIHALTPLNVWALISFMSFGVGLMTSYAASTIYHWVSSPNLKAHLRKFDHAAIYFLIAGTYTPFTLLLLRDAGGCWGWLIFGIVWGCAALGIAMNFGQMKRNNHLKTLSYIAMGWMVIFVAKPLWDVLSAQGSLDVIWWVAAGGVFYTIGAVIYAMAKREFVHTIWHILVLCGSICHFIAVLKIPI